MGVRAPEHTARIGLMSALHTVHRDLLHTYIYVYVMCNKQTNTVHLHTVCTCHSYSHTCIQVCPYPPTPTSQPTSPAHTHPCTRSHPPTTAPTHVQYRLSGIRGATCCKLLRCSCMQCNETHRAHLRDPTGTRHEQRRPPNSHH